MLAIRRSFPRREKLRTFARGMQVKGLVESRTLNLLPITSPFQKVFDGFIFPVFSITSTIHDQRLNKGEKRCFISNPLKLLIQLRHMACFRCLAVNGKIRSWPKAEVPASMYASASCVKHYCFVSDLIVRPHLCSVTAGLMRAN